MTTNTADGTLDPKRRKFLEIAIGMFGGATILGMTYPIASFLLPRREKSVGGAKRSMQIQMAEVPIGEAKFIRFLNKPTVVIRPNEQEIVALSAVCTHLGCVVKWKENSGELFCPCHGGIFDVKGNVLSGPPPTPLPSIVVKTEADYIVLEEA